MGPRKAKALVCEWEDGTMEVSIAGAAAFTELPETIRKTARPHSACRQADGGAES